MTVLPSIYIWSAGSALFALVGMVIAHRIVKPIDLKENQAQLDATLNIVGTLVSILLGLLVAASLNNYQTLESAVDSEAVSIAEVCRLSYGLPDTERKAILKTCLDYCEKAINEEWPAMQRGEASDAVLLSYADLLKHIVSLQPKTSGETNIQAAMINSMQSWGNYRRQRMLWINNRWDRNLMPVLFMCSLIVLVFSYLYVKSTSIILHGFLICFVATALGANIGLIFLLSHPFGGDWAIKPRGFEVNVNLIHKFTDVH